MPPKRCYGCKAFKPEAEYARDRHQRDGLNTVCKSCKSAYRKTYRKDELGRARDRFNKRLFTARKRFIEAFGYRPNREELLQYLPRLEESRKRIETFWRLRRCLLARCRQLQVQAKGQAKDALFRVPAKTCRVCRVSKPKADFWLDASKRDGRTNTCRACKRILDINGKARSINKRGARIGLDEEMTAELVEEILQRFERKCFRCGSSSQLCLDHHLPVRHRRRLRDGNAVVLCKACNSEKGQRHPSRFYTPEEQARLLKVHQVPT